MKTPSEKTNQKNMIAAIILAAITILIPMAIVFVIKFADAIDRFTGK
jgi:hypothetical protein